MKVRAQIGMVLNLDKCIGCHTCSVTCKNVWTSRDGVEYAWFNNVETKPGIGYPKQWENQKKWNGGWVRTESGKLEPRQGGKLRILANLFANPNLPAIDDYYEPFTYDYQHLQNAPRMKTPPTARPVSVLTGEKMDKIEWGPNWEDDLAGEFSKLDQDKCRGWRMCISGCPYKKIYFNWQSGKAEKCLFCYPRIEAGQPTVCSETCVGRIRYLGVMLYDADRIEAAAAVPDDKQLYKAQLDCFLDPNDPAVIEAARKEGIPDSWLDAARKSPVYRMAVKWEVAFPLHPEYRTLPMVWYIPPLSPIQSAAENKQMPHEVVEGSIIPNVKSLRIPVRYLANLLTAGEEAPIVKALERMVAMRAWKRGEMINGQGSQAVLDRVGLDADTVEDMYQTMAIANYEDRFVIPTSYRAAVERNFSSTGDCGFSFGNGCSSGYSDGSLFGKNKQPKVDVIHLQLKRPRQTEKQES